VEHPLLSPELAVKAVFGAFRQTQHLRERVVVLQIQAAVQQTLEALFRLVQAALAVLATKV
jgi:hypothetical protein